MCKTEDKKALLEELSLMGVKISPELDAWVDGIVDALDNAEQRAEKLAEELKVYVDAKEAERLRLAEEAYEAEKQRQFCLLDVWLPTESPTKEKLRYMENLAIETFMTKPTYEYAADLDKSIAVFDKLWEKFNEEVAEYKKAQRAAALAWVEA